MCTAWESGQGGENGKKNDATAFQRLTKAAGKASVQDFCDGVIAQHGADHPSSRGAAGQSSTAPGLSTANVKSGGHSGAGPGNSHRP